MLKPWRSVPSPARFWPLNQTPVKSNFAEGRTSQSSVKAREATGTERERLWKKAASVWPDYDAYQARAPHRKIPVVVLEPR